MTLRFTTYSKSIALAFLFLFVTETVSFGRLAAEVIYNRGIDGDPETLDPQKTSGTNESKILRDLFEGLVIHDAMGKLIPGVARNWEVSTDGKTYTFHLRSKAKWSNGDPVQASDFVFSFRRLFTPATAARYANLFYPILGAERMHRGLENAANELGVEAVDRETLVIKLERPTPYFLEILALRAAYPLHPKTVQANGADFVRPGILVSNGAYFLSDNIPNSGVVLKKNFQHYDADNVHIDTIYYQPVKDISAGARRFLAGELHSVSDFPADQYRLLRDRLGDQVSVAPYLGTYYLAFNTQKKPFSDARIRNALSMVIDREFLSDSIWSSTMLPAYSFIPPGIENYEQPVEVYYRSQNPIEREEAARGLLREAGYGPGLQELTLSVRYNESDNNRRTIVAIADMWKRALGVNTTIINSDSASHFSHLRNGGDFDVARGGWIADYSDPQNFLFLFQSDNKGLNYSRYTNPEFDGLMRRAADQTSVPTRMQLLRAAETIISRDAPYVPLLFYANRNLISSKLKGFHPNLLGANATRFMQITP